MGPRYINICAVNPFADPLAFSRRPSLLTAALPFPRTLSFYYAYLSTIQQLYDLRFNSVRPRVIDSPTMISLPVRADESEFSPHQIVRSIWSQVSHNQDVPER